MESSPSAGSKSIFGRRRQPAAESHLKRGLRGHPDSQLCSALEEDVAFASTVPVTTHFFKRSVSGRDLRFSRVFIFFNVLIQWIFSERSQISLAIPNFFLPDLANFLERSHAQIEKTLSTQFQFFLDSFGKSTELRHLSRMSGNSDKIC